MSEKRPRGRPKLPEGAARDKSVRIRFTSKELGKLEEAARIADMTVSEFVREWLAGVLGN